MKDFLPEGRRFQTEENQKLIRSPVGLIQARERQLPLEGVADHWDREGNLWVTLGSGKGIIPKCKIAMGTEEGHIRETGIPALVGKPVTFLVNRIEGRDGALLPVLDRRSCQEQAWEKLRRLEPGSILSATVTKLEPFGAFVDIGCGIPSLIGIEQISVSRIPHPSCRFFEGQEIFVLVTGILPHLRRITLSHRELLGTWEENARSYAPGDIVAGTVRSIMEYGMFIELTPNLSGLAERTEGIQEGNAVTVCIKSIQPQRMKIKLAVLKKHNVPLPLRPLCYRHTSGTLSHWYYAPKDCEKTGTAAWNADLHGIRRE